MAITISWYPSSDPTIITYLLQSAPAQSGPYSTIASITANVLNTSAFNPLTGQYFYLDGAGTNATWYRLAQVNNLSVQGPWSPSFQPGTNPTPSQVAYSTQQLLASIKSTGRLPKTGSKQFADSDLLTFATEELRSTILPKIISIRKDYYNGYVDFDSTVKDPNDPRGFTYGPFPLPYRAIGSDPKCLYLVMPDGNPAELARLEEEDLPYQGYGFYIRNNNISVLLNNGNLTQYLRVSYYLRPNQLVTVDQVAFVAAFSQSAATITLSNVPVGFTAYAGTYDIIKSGPSFDLRAFDLSGSLSGNVISFPAGVLPLDLAVGDQVSLSDQSAIVQLPVEFHPALVRAVVVRCMDALGDVPAMQRSEAKLEVLMDTALSLIKNRITGNPATILAINGPYKRGGYY